MRFEAQVKVAQDTLKLAQEELQRAHVRFRVGEVTKTDILRAEVAVERASRALVVDRNAAETRPHGAGSDRGAVGNGRGAGTHPTPGRRE